MIFCLLVAHNHSIIFLNYSSVFNLITMLLKCISSLRFSVLNSSSIGANWGLYVGKNITLFPKEFKYSINSFEVWIGELSSSNKIFFVSTLSSTFIHLTRFSINLMNTQDQFLSIKFVKYKSPLRVIVPKRDTIL